jgi:probable F420-dependent oxidoreductase
VKFWQSIAFAETDQLADICKIAESFGFAGVALAEHLVTPKEISSPYPYSPDGKAWWDPSTHWFDNWVLAGWLAAQTTTLRFINSVYILPLRDPITAAKSIASAAYLSNNRCTLGFGVGWMREEFDMTGQRFENRGRRTDEMLDVMSKLWSGEMVEHHGEFYDFPPVQMSPAPTERIPVVAGGHSERAMRRAARLDGWFGYDAYQPDAVPPLIDRLRRYRAEAGVADEPFEIYIGLGVPPTVDILRRLRDAGVTAFVNVPWYYQGTPTSSIEWKRDAMERLAETLIAPLQEG